ncbi:MAG: phage baseplate protein [Cyanobacteria bacterium J06581_3]
MRDLTASDLLYIWEWGQGRSLIQQALMILSVAYPDLPPHTLAQLPIGQRDAQLLNLRSRTFGPQIQSVAHCPNCAETLEYSLTVQDITLTPVKALDNHSVTEPAFHSWKKESYDVRFRLPTSNDLLAIKNLSVTEASAVLLAKCIDTIESPSETSENKESNPGGKSLTPAQLPGPIAKALIDHIGQQDPQAEIELALSCPSCQHQWHQLFDIVAYFWQEIATAAQRLLSEVHTLAAAYSWSEADILALSPRRRQAYLKTIMAIAQ